MIVVECLYTSNEIEEETILREQQKRCLAAAASYGWAVRREVFEPLQLSARGMDDRTGIQTILDDVCNRRFDLLMIASMDRLSYDKEEVKAFLAEMDLNGISIFNVGSNTVTLASASPGAQGDHGLAQFVVVLARAREADFTRIGPSVESDLQFASRGDVDAVDTGGHVGDQCRHRIGLHRIVQLDLGGQGGAQLGYAAIKSGAVVGIERRLAHAGSKARDGLAADQEFSVGMRKLVHRRVRRRGTGSSGHGQAAGVNSVLRVLRSILPFWLRGRAP